MKLRKKESDRRLMSFEKEIVDDVYNKVGGVVSKQKIRYLLRASISYAMDLLYFTECTEVILPYIGRMRSNLSLMRSRRDKLLSVKAKRRFLSPDLQKELDMLGVKVADMESRHKADKGFMFGTYYWCNASYRRRYYLSFMDAGELQDFQNEVFEE